MEVQTLLKFLFNNTIVTAIATAIATGLVTYYATNKYNNKKNEREKKLKKTTICQDLLNILNNLESKAEDMRAELYDFYTPQGEEEEIREAESILNNICELNDSIIDLFILFNGRINKYNECISDIFLLENIKRASVYLLTPYYIEGSFVCINNHKSLEVVMHLYAKDIKNDNIYKNSNKERIELDVYFDLKNRNVGYSLSIISNIINQIKNDDKLINIPG